MKKSWLGYSKTQSLYYSVLIILYISGPGFGAIFCLWRNGRGQWSQDSLWCKWYIKYPPNTVPEQSWRTYNLYSLSSCRQFVCNFFRKLLSRSWWIFTGTIYRWCSCVVSYSFLIMDMVWVNTNFSSRLLFLGDSFDFWNDFLFQLFNKLFLIFIVLSGFAVYCIWYVC